METSELQQQESHPIFANISTNVLESILQPLLSPYVTLIADLTQKQKAKEAELLVIKYAFAELDRKYQDLEKLFKAKTSGTKTTTSKTTGSSAAASRNQVVKKDLSISAAVSRNHSRAPSATNSTRNTPKEASRRVTTAKDKQNTSSIGGQAERPRSKTPVGSRQVENKLRESIRPNKNAVNNSMNASMISRGSSRAGSGVRNSQDLQSQGQKNLKNTSSLIAQNRALTGHSRNAGSGLDKSRPSSKSARESIGGTRKGTSDSKDFEKSSAIQTPSALKQKLQLTGGQDPLNKFFNMAVQAQFGKNVSYVYAMDKKPNHTDPQQKPSNDVVKLAYVPSYNGRNNMRNNIEFIDSHNIAFFASTVGIIMNIETYEQYLMTGHTDEIQCLAYNEQKKLLCTAQKSTHNHHNTTTPFLTIWDLQLIRQPYKITSLSYHQKSINQVAFSNNGKHLITVGGQSDKQSIAVWSVKEICEHSQVIGNQNSKPITNLQPICEHPIGKTLINSLYVDPKPSSSDNLNIVLGAEKSIKFFTVVLSQKIIEEKKVTLGGHGNENLRNILNIGFHQDEIYAAGDNGLVYQVRSDKVADSKFRAENTAIQCLGFIQRNQNELLMTIAEEGKISFWHDQDLVEQIEILDEEIKCKLGSETIFLSPRAFCYRDGILIVGFEQNIILKITLANQKSAVIHPKHKTFIVVSHDKYVRFYSYETLSKPLKNTLINSIELQNVPKSCDLSPDGRFLAIGYDAGIFEVFQVYDNDGEYYQIDCLKMFDLNRKHPISCVKFSPDQRFLVITCDKGIVVFNAQTEDLDQDGFLKGNSAQVNFIQFDKKSQYAMTNAVDGQIIVWELSSGSFSKVEASKVKDVEWDRKSCVYAWDTLGIWSPEMKETDVNNVNISNDQQLIATADNLGRVRLFLYPAYLPRQNSLSLDCGHISHVQSVLFTKEDDYLITIGSLDCAIMIWSYKKNSNQNVISRKNTHNKDILDANVILQLENINEKKLRKELSKQEEEDENLLEQSVELPTQRQLR